MKVLFMTFFLLFSCQEKSGAPTDPLFEGQSQGVDTQLRSLIDVHRLSPNNFIEVESSLTKLGQKLFNDPNLSSKQDISCSTCHGSSSTENISFSIGTGGESVNESRAQALGVTIRRNSPHLHNLGSNQFFAFWDGRVQFLNGKFTLPEEVSSETESLFVDALDAQTLFPILSRDEMRGQLNANTLSNITDSKEYLKTLLEQRVLSDEMYMTMFTEAYPDVESFNPGHMAHAMGRFIKNNWNVRNTPYDRYLAGDNSSLTINQKRGFRIFLTKGQCIQCHTGVNLTDNTFHSIGVPHIFPSISNNSDDLGRGELTGNQFDNYKFKTPGLRNIAKTAPYMHNGSFGTLEEVVVHYNNIEDSLNNFEITAKIQENYTEEIVVDRNSVRNNERFSQIDKRQLQRGLRLSAQEQIDLVDFLKSLSN